MKKYTMEREGSLYRITRILGGVRGGLIESERNLSHEGSCWVYGEGE